MGSDADDLRPVNQPQPIAVIIDAQHRGTIMLGRVRVPIAGILDVWLSQDEWWRPTPIDRLYVAVVLENGRYLTIFRDRLTNRWYAQPYDLPCRLARPWISAHFAGGPPEQHCMSAITRRFPSRYETDRNAERDNRLHWQ